MSKRMWHKAINVVVALVLAVMLVPLFQPATPVAASPDPPLYQAYSSASSSGDVVSINVPMPTGTVENDLLVALFTKDATTGTLSSPGDWTDVCDLSTGASRFMVAYKLAGAAESGPYTFSSTDSDQMACGIARITGADTTTPINAQSSTNTGSDDAPQCLAATTDADDCLVLRCMGADDDDYSSGNNYPSGHTGRFTVQSAGSWSETHCALATKSQASAGDTGTADFAMTAAEQWGTITLAINPLAGAYTEQLHFRWRDDTTDLNSSGGWHAAEDSNDIGMLDKNTTIRLRMEVANTGTGAESEARTYELQWAQKSTDCDACTGWAGVGDASDAFDMVGTTHIDPDGESATPGLLANSETYTFVTGEGRDTADTTGSIGPLSASYYTELEYSFKATDSASAGTSYCFRLYDTTAGAPLDSYTVWPEVAIYQVPDVDQTHYRWRNDNGEETGSWTVDGQTYTTRRMLTIDDSLIDADQTDFPVRVSLASFPGIDLDKFNSDGNDIRFTKFDGTTLLKYERESFDQTADTGEVWVKIPNVRSSASDDNRFFIYYRTTDTTDGEDATNVWDANYKAVHHLSTATQSTVTTNCEYFSDTFSRALVRTDDDNKTIHVFYAKDPGDTMSLWWRKSTDDGATWSSETQIGTSNGRASLATATVGPNGKDIHMSYCYYSGATINHHYMYYRKLSWNSGTESWDIGSEAEVHNETGYETADSSLVVDSGEVVHLVFLWSDGSTGNKLYYENNSAGNWDASPTELASDTSWIIGVVQLDSDRNLHVVSSYDNLIQWRKATYSAGPSWSWAASWTSISGGTFTDAWSHVNTCMDANDRLHVAWGGYATSYRPLKYARKNANDTWETTITIDSGNNHSYTEITAYGDKVYVTAAYNSGTGQIVFYRSSDAGANFGSRMAITDTSANLRFHSRISRYGVRPVFEGAWRQGSTPWDVKYTLIDELDSTANDNDGSCVGALDPNVTGQIDSGDDFDGSDDYIDIGTGPTSVKTISFWVYPQTTTEYFINVTSTTDYIWANAGTVTATGFTSPTIYVNGVASTTLDAGEWQHVAITTDTAENASNLDIGRTADANYLEGTMDEVRLAQTARTAAWLKAEYNSENDSLLTYGSEETGTGTAATWKAAEDTPATGQARFENLRVRFSIKNTGGTASDYNYRLQVSDNQTSGYADVPLFSTPGTSVACMATSANFADQDATTRQLGWPGSLSWTAGKMVEDTSNQTDAITLNKNYFTEVEFNFLFTSVAQGSTTYYFRLVNSTTDLDSYTQVAEITMGDIPTWESYSDAPHSTQCDTFDEYPAEHWVYMYGEGFTPAETYKVIYWDGTDYKRVVDSSVQANGNGDLSSSHAFELGDEPGDWQCVAYYPDTHDPSSYSTTDSNISGDDVSYTNAHAFHMEAVAIPEFPTIISAIAAMGLCFGIYWWMRRRKVYNRVR